MRPWLLALLIFGSLSGLLLACYGGPILRGEQFAFRDAGNYYYPLHQRVQAEWDAGRWPLWEPEENSGMPLLGNPTAAVLYPGKVVFALLDYPLAARLYIIGHTLLAFAAMLALLRHWRTSWVGAALGALAYAFSGPILFQYCNVIYLVGAAWLPLGFRAVDRWLRLRQPIALGELAVVLALQVLGGDPQTAYLTGVCALGYAVALAWPRKDDREARTAGTGATSLMLRHRVLLGLVLLLVIWVFLTLAAAVWAPTFRPVRPPEQPRAPLPWSPWVGPVITMAWVLLGVILILRWRGRRKAGQPTVLVPMLGGLILSAALAASMSAAQLLPVLEFTSQSWRAATDGEHAIYPFSFAPARLLELVWPRVFGTVEGGNAFWLEAVPPRIGHGNPWVNTVYLGGLTLVLALAGFRLVSKGGATPWLPWLSVIVVVSLLGSFGEYGSPLYLARRVPGLESWIGPRDPLDPNLARSYRDLRDGDGGVYWLLSTALPGFSQFRYPSKLLTFTMLGLSCLAARGWDALAAGDPFLRRRVVAWSGGLLAITLALLALSFVFGGEFRAWLDAQGISSVYGPLDPQMALAETRGGLVQAALVLSLALVLALWLASRRPLLAASLVLVVLAADLARANAHLIWTVPQAVMDSHPEIVSIIERAEQETPSPGPYRVHRMPIWGLSAWSEPASPGRFEAHTDWNRQTIEPKYGINHGIHYTLSLGVTELYDYRWFFGGFRHKARGRAVPGLGVAPETEIIVYPRRSFDMWNTRYFVLPFYTRWDDENRGVASFIDRTEQIYPPPSDFAGPEGEENAKSWAFNQDFQIRRNLDVYPRAWVVHDSRTLAEFQGVSRAGRDQSMEEMLFSNDLTWSDPHRVVYDPRRIVWLGKSDRAELAPFLPGGNPLPGETAKVVRQAPDLLELEVELQRPGIVVLADVYYPGWTLTIDGQEAPIYRANRMMRGAAVTEGRHTLIFTYRPSTFRIGLMISIAGLVALGGLALWSVFGRR